MRMAPQENSVLTSSDIEARGFWSPEVTVTRVIGTRHCIETPEYDGELGNSFCNECGEVFCRKLDDGLILCAGCGTRQTIPTMAASE